MRSLAVLALLLAAPLASCGAEDGSGSRAQSPQWVQLPDPPLSPRDHAVVVGVGDQALVAGGWEFLCPPNGDCGFPDGPLLRDAAVYDSASDTWRPAASAPAGMLRGEQTTAALGRTAYVVTACADRPECAAQPRLLAYDLDADRWTDHGPVPGPRRPARHLTTLGDDLVVSSASDEGGGAPDAVFDPRTGAWTTLPDDPLPRSSARQVLADGERLLLTASPIEDDTDPPVSLAAVYDPATATWTRLPDAPGQGYELLPTSRGPLLNGHFVEAPGWLLDPADGTWTELPGGAGVGDDVRGVVGRGTATYDIPNSVAAMTSQTRVRVYDDATGELVVVPPLVERGEVYDDASGAVGRDLLVFGGQRWSGSDASDPGEGVLVGDAWLWRAPDPS